MPSYNHRFIYNIIYSDIDNNAKNKGRTNGSDSERSIRKLPASEKEGIAGNQKARCPEHHTGIRRRIRPCKRSILQSERRKANTEIPRRKFRIGILLPSFIFSNNSIQILQSLDDMCFHINPVLFNTLQTFINTGLYR